MCRSIDIQRGLNDNGSIDGDTTEEENYIRRAENIMI